MGALVDVSLSEFVRGAHRECFRDKERVELTPHTLSERIQSNTVVSTIISGVWKRLFGASALGSTTVPDPDSWGTPSIQCPSADSATSLARNQVQDSHGIDTFQARATPTDGHSHASTISEAPTSTGILTLETITTTKPIILGKRAPASDTVSTTSSITEPHWGAPWFGSAWSGSPQRTGPPPWFQSPPGTSTTNPASTTPLAGTSSQSSSSLPPSPSLPQSSGSNASKTNAIVGGVAGASVFTVFAMVLIVFWIMRRKRRLYIASILTSREAPFSPDIPGPQMAQFTTAPAPFLGFSGLQNRPSPERIIPSHTRGILAQKNRGDIEQGVNPFESPVSAGRSSPINNDEGRQDEDALARLQEYTSQFEGELQRLSRLAKSGQLSTEDRIRLDGIRGTTGLTIPCSPRRNRSSSVGSVSSDSSSSIPPSYCTQDN